MKFKYIQDFIVAFYVRFTRNSYQKKNKEKPENVREIVQKGYRVHSLPSSICIPIQLFIS